MTKQRYWHGLNQWLNPMGFGCWQIAGEHYVNNKPNGWGHVNENKAIELIHKALDHNIHFFDTAVGYGNGKSEEILGKAIYTSLSKEMAVICTKIPLSKHEIEQLRLDDSFLTKVDTSLKRLKRNQIDILLLHNPPDSINWQQFDKTLLEKLQQEGKIRTYGVSNRSIKGVNAVLDAKFGTCIEWVFNLLERRPIALFQAMKEAKINFIARSPLSRGLFATKHLDQITVFDKMDFRSTLSKDWMQWVRETINALNLSKLEKADFSKIALQYCLQFEEVSALIPGIKREEHLVEYLKIATNQYLTKELVTKLNTQTPPCFPLWK